MFVAPVAYVERHVGVFSGKASGCMMFNDCCDMPLCKLNTSFAFFLILLGVAGVPCPANTCVRLHL